MNTSRRGKAVQRGHNVGLTRAKADLKRRDAEAKEVEYERVLRSRAFRKEVAASQMDSAETSASECPITENLSSIGPEEIRARGVRNAAVIMEVTRKSGHLQGPFIKKLRDAAADMQSLHRSFVYL